PARSSTLRCFEIAGWLMSNGVASSETEASPSANRARMARRVGSASAANVASRRASGAIMVDNRMVMDNLACADRVVHGCSGSRDRRRRRTRLNPPKRRVQPTQLDELVMGAELHDPAALEHADPVRAADGREPVRDR